MKTVHYDLYDHDMFLQWLATEYARTGEVVTRMRSYLVNREQNISINNTLSDKITQILVFLKVHALVHLVLNCTLSP